jgi:hypothetical protein
MDFQFKSEVEGGLRRVRELLLSNVILDRTKPFYRKSVFIEILVHMKDLLMKANISGKRISFTDDIIPDPELKINDVTDLIANFRDAAVHSDSYRKKVGINVSSGFNEIWGNGVLFSIDGIKVENKYQDDIGFNMGKHVMLYRRHLIRAFEEVNNYFVPLL